MRPLKITMSAFGPYAGEVTLDMQKLGKSGIYLSRAIRAQAKRRFLMRFLMRFTARQAEITGKILLFAQNMQVQIHQPLSLCRT